MSSPSSPRAANRTGKTGLLALLSLLALIACGDDSAKPVFDPDRADSPASAIDLKGRISFGGEALGEFITEDQQDGYFFTAEAGAVITIDNTNRGTSRHLDSTLAVFGPADASGSYGSQAVVTDDDGDWGTHAKIKNFTVPSRGDYLVVLSTYAGADRGHYRLALECDGDSCVVPCDETCDAVACGAQTCDVVDGCVSQPEAANECSDISVSASEVTTSAGGDSETFLVRLETIPEEHVIIRLATSDVDQAAVYPLKISFCKPGFAEDLNGCEEIETGTGADESWSRDVLVTVTGARSLRADGDVPFQISMSVESEDEHYASIRLAPISGINLGDSAAPSLSQFSGLQDSELLLALHELTNDHLGFGYRGQNSARNIMFSEVDVHDGEVEGIYTGQTIERPIDSSVAFQRGFNSEHTWPQSQFDEVEPARSDLHHVFPADTDTNGIRSSFDFGITNPVSSTSQLGANANGPGTVFQVRPERRGDVARAHFYLVARYANDSSLGIDFDDDNDRSNGSIKDSEENVLRAWHEQDPVDDLERTRNNRIEAFQGNRNPFIDRPELVNQVADF